MRKEEIEKKTKEMLDYGFSKPYVAWLIARMKEESNENESRERMYKYVDESSLH